MMRTASKGKKLNLADQVTKMWIIINNSTMMKIGIISSRYSREENNRGGYNFLMMKHILFMVYKLLLLYIFSTYENENHNYL